jgi:lipopolysaccharide export system protein LptA
LRKSVSVISLLLLIAVGLNFTNAQQKNAQDEYITVVGDSLKGLMINGESIREVYGHVVLTQGRVVITCEKATQYISRNDALLEGNVVAKQDTLTILTPRATYYGFEKRSRSNSGLTLNDTKVILTADSGDYYYREDRAFFQGDVRLYDTVTTLTSNQLTYFKSQNRMIAIGNVKIVDSTNTIYADSLENFRATRITFANKNVKITSTSNNVVIYGDHLEDYANKSYTFINKNPLLIQIDSSVSKDTLKSLKDSSKVRDSVSIRLDTMIIRSVSMESFRDTINRFEAKDSVRILRGSFASVNDYSIYFRNQSTIVTKKMGENRPQPILWNENTQMTGDSVAIHLVNNRIKFLEVINNAFLLSQNELFKKRYDQISGEKIYLTFDSLGITSTEVKGQVLSIYYLYDDSSGNGLTKSSSQTALLKFENRKVTEVRMYGYPKSDYYPEGQVEGKELSFTLPTYIIYSNRPTKENLLKK